MSDDPRIAPLGKFTPEGSLTPGYGDHYLFLVGRDDCHGVLSRLIRAETLAFKFNMFGYDDDELNDEIIALLKSESVRVQGTLDKSQSGGVHERTILAKDEALLGSAYGNSFAVGQSATHQISHTKGGVLLAQGLGFEGSMNWSKSGEGIGINLHGKEPVHFQAQNNTLLVSSNPVFLSRFGEQLDNEHMVALAQAAKAK